MKLLDVHTVPEVQMFQEAVVNRLQAIEGSLKIDTPGVKVQTKDNKKIYYHKYIAESEMTYQRLCHHHHHHHYLLLSILSLFKKSQQILNTHKAIMNLNWSPFI